MIRRRVALVGGAALGCVAFLVGACDGQYRFDERRDAGAPADARGAGCAADADCGLLDLHCDTVSGACVACTLDEHCTSPTTPDCDTALHRCVECGSSSACGAGRVCEPITHTCLTACRDHTQCAPPALGCLDDVGCVSCVRNSDCVSASTASNCDVANGRCVQCAFDSQCGAPTTHCERTSGKCVECLGPSDCGVAAPLCDPAGWRCVAHP